MARKGAIPPRQRRLSLASLGRDKAGKGGRTRFSWLKRLGWPVRLGLVRLLLLLIVATVVAVVLVQFLGPPLLELRDAMVRELGVGLAVVLVALLAILSLSRPRPVLNTFKRLRGLLRLVSCWLAVVAFAFTALGILAFFAPLPGILGEVSLGGTFGRRIIGAPDWVGAARLVGLFLLGLALVVPRPFFRTLWRILRWTALAVGRAVRRLYRASAGRSQPTPEAEEPLQIQKLATRGGALGRNISQVPPRLKSFITRRQRPVEAPAVPHQLPLEPVSPPEARPQAPAEAGATEGWRLPSPSLLDASPATEFSRADVERKAALIKEALASYGVETNVVQINVGPTVTQFGVEPGWDKKYREIKERDEEGNTRVRREEVSRIRVKVERITSLANDLALALAAPSLRIEAPVPGKSMVGIEVPNAAFGLVSLREVVESSSLKKLLAKSKLAIALGKGAGGEPVVADLARMPHLLIAGATGSGKTVCLNSVIACLLMHNTPDEVQFLMVDPKRVELVQYNMVPHLATSVIVDATKAMASLRWLNAEMDERYHKLAAVGARNIDAYNRNPLDGRRLPYLVLIVDELADLMMAQAEEVEPLICRLAQLARATGIHLVVATQRPSVDVITGLIKANFPTRISFAVVSQVDSRTILDTAGAEKLLGRGDMLYLPTEAMKPKRLQGCFVSDRETERLVYFWASQRPAAAGPRFREDLLRFLAAAGAPTASKDVLLDSARQLVREHGRISTSFLQRRLNIGYPRAARLMDMLEAEGLVERGEPDKSRPVVFRDGAEAQGTMKGTQNHTDIETGLSGEVATNAQGSEKQER